MDARTLHRKRLEREEFHALFDLAPEQREARLDALAREDAALAAELRRLLARADAADIDTDAAAPGQRVGSVVSGRFRLLRLLGAGGMGEVYLAERTDEIDKKVALKLVRGDLPLPLERARRERQILARLEHPNIAGLVDAGLTESGQPWFAMAYVDGEPITAWCDRRSLDLRARVRLFARAVEAVQFAHRNLVLHRDLKPSNILVDADGAPKLLDFGIAKLLDATDPKQTQTLALTPAYAAPEQLRGETATTASDVYQLGLVLYELLGGVAACDAREAARSSMQPAPMLPRMDQALAVFAQRDGAAAEHIARCRRLSVDKLRRALKGDLGRIAGKAAADDPHERYATAQALADDLERWASGLPVAAHRGSFGYRLRKLVRRHAIATAAVLLLGFGMAATSVIAVRRATAEREQREQAVQQQRRAQTLLDIMRDVFKEAEPSRAKGGSVSPGDLIARAAAKLEQRSDLDPTSRAMLDVELADVWRSQEHSASALPVVRRAVAILAPQRILYPVEYLHGMVVLVGLLHETARYSEAVAAVDEDVLGFARNVRDGGHRWYQVLLTYRSSAAALTGQRVLAEADLRMALQEVGTEGVANNADQGFTLSQAGLFHSQTGDKRLALEFFRRALAVSDPEDDPINRLVNEANIGSIQVDVGEPMQAIPVLRGAWRELGRLVGTGYDRTVLVGYNLARAYVAVGDQRGARTVLEECASALNQEATNTQTQILISASLAKLDMQAGDLRAALALPSDLDATAAPSRPAVVVGAVIGEALLKSGRLAEACAKLKQVESSALAVYSGTSSRVADIHDSLGRCLLANGDTEAALASLRSAVGTWQALQGADTPAVVRSEIHELWAELVATGNVALLDDLERKRDVLARRLENANSSQIQQVDSLIRELRRLVGGSISIADRRLNADGGGEGVRMQHKLRLEGLDSFSL